MRAVALGAVTVVRAVEHVVAHLDVLSRFVADMGLRLRVVEQAILTA